MNTISDNKKLQTIILACAAYLALVIFSNLGSLRILSFGNFSLDGGTLLYPLTFTARDLLHKKSGAAITRFTILLTAVVNLLMFGFCWLVGSLPPDLAVGPQAEYALVLNPGLRLVLGSILAMTLAELLDTLVYSRVRRRYGGKKQWLRVLLSNAVSAPLDTAVFLLIAFAGRYPMSVLIALFLSNLVIKYCVTLLSLGSVYLVREDEA